MKYLIRAIKSCHNCYSYFYFLLRTPPTHEFSIPNMYSIPFESHRTSIMACKLPTHQFYQHPLCILPFESHRTSFECKIRLTCFIDSHFVVLRLLVIDGRTFLRGETRAVGVVTGADAESLPDAHPGRVGDCVFPADLALVC